MNRVLSLLCSAAFVLAPAAAGAMNDASIPTKVPTTWGTSAPGGDITCPMPIPSQISVAGGRASWTDGFPPLTFLSTGAGGIPPFGQDFNGVLCQLSQWVRWFNAGAPIIYDGAFQTAIGGYPNGAIVGSALKTGNYWLSIVDNNTSDPDTGGANWVGFTFLPDTISTNTTFYVSPTGSDSNNCLTSLTACATLQHTWNTIVSSVNLNGYAATIQVADGTYTLGLSANSMPAGVLGAYPIVINGDAGTPSNVVISVTNANAILAEGPVQLEVQNMKLQATTSGNLLEALYGANISFSNIVFGSSLSSNQIAAEYGGSIVATGNYSINGSAYAHLSATFNGVITINGVTVSLTGTPGFSYAFAAASGSGSISAVGNTFSGGATGSRFNANGNGTIYTQGQSTTYFPGNVSGSGAFGGQYY